MVSKTVIRPDLIPATSWGSSLCNLLARRSWEVIREPVLSLAKHKCVLCGKRGTDCHELWGYSEPPPGVPDVIGVQRLMGLVALCQPCHEMFHWGFANIRGRGAEVLGRLMRHNEWKSSELAAYQAEQIERHKARSMVGLWALDLTIVASSGMIIAKGWRRDGEIGDGDVLRRKLYEVETLSYILGADYEIDGGVRGPVSPGQGYDLGKEAGDFGFADWIFEQEIAWKG